MRVLVILAHPSPGSFNHAIADSVRNALLKNGHRIIFHDLYSERFDPILREAEISGQNMRDGTVIRHCRELEKANGLIFIHPNWWGQPPAILKGWIDRIVRPGVAYRFQEGDSGEGVPVGLLAGKKAVVFNTSDTPEEREKKIFGDPLDSIWNNCIFGFCGIDNSYRRTFSIVVLSTPEQRNIWLEEAAQTIERIFPAG